MSARRYTREELAALEVGSTDVSPLLARVIVLFFLAVVFCVPVLQELSGYTDKDKGVVSIFSSTFGGVFAAGLSGSFIQRVEDVNEQLLQAKDSAEEELEDKTLLHELFWPVQKFLLVLKKGNEKVLPGEGEWLFYSKDVEHLLSSLPAGTVYHPEKNVNNDPVKAIVDFRDKLQQKGVQLVVMPTPVKPMIQPEKLATAQAVDSDPLYFEGWEDVKTGLVENGINFIDPAPLLQSYMHEQGKPAFLKTDTHWTPGAMEYMAQYLAAYVAQMQLALEDAAYKREVQTVINQGDIASMLKLPDEKMRMNEEVEIHPVFTRGSELWRQSSTGAVLLLGDSFSNIFSQGSMGWGRGAGFGEQLSYYLNTPIDTIIQNDQGAYVTREKLSVDQARGIDRLNNTQLVIWQFAARELNQGHWKIIDLPEGREENLQEFYLVPAGVTKKVRGEIRDISKSPRPGSVPYKDNIITMHLSNVEDLETGEMLGECLVYTWGMKNNELTAMATRRIGEQVTLALRDWAEVEVEYAAIRRSVLDDEMIEYEMPNWGEIIQ